MKQEYSALIGVVGGVIDLVAGIAILQPTAMMEAEPNMATPTSLWAGYFLMALGIIVLLTGLYLLTSRMMNRSFVSSLMLLYGVIMVVLGIGMLVRILSMMQNSMLSGAAMLISGLAMLYSGYDMTKKSSH